MTLSWTKDNRYYKLLFQPTLFGTTDVIRIWGRIGSNLGGYKIISCDGEEDIVTIVDRIKKRRKYRGYRCCLKN
jgi:predicted DNA-binding WGR domain protein